MDQSMKTFNCKRLIQVDFYARNHVDVVWLLINPSIDN